MFSKRLKRLARAVGGPSAAEREQAYLDGSMSILDLERRQDEIDRGAFRRHPRLY